MLVIIVALAVGARKLEHDRLPTPDHEKKEHQHRSSYIHVATFWGLLYIYISISTSPYIYIYSPKQSGLGFSPGKRKAPGWMGGTRI